ncbi:MAG: mobile mystery protein A [Pseudomonadota bacterium]
MARVQDTAKRQAARFLDKAAEQLAGLKPPRGGWIATMRKTLGMTAPALARRAGVTKSAIYQAERHEREGGVTIKHMEKLAAALGGRIVYAIVPDGRVDDIRRAQARAKAEAIIKRASAHMALEKQALSASQLNDEIERLADDLMRDPPSDFWEAL